MNKADRSDAELVRSVLASHTEDFKILMERYQQKIYVYLYRFLYQNREAALDITQDVFIKVYENLATVDLKRPIQPWIYRIAHNEAANYLRSISRKRESNLEDDQWNNFSNAESDQVEADDTRQIILEALDSLDEKYREVLVLFFFEERTYKEIAEMLDSSTNSVGTLINRGKKQLEKILNDRMGNEPFLTNIIFGFFFIVSFNAPHLFPKGRL